MEFGILCNAEDTTTDCASDMSANELHITTLALKTLRLCKALPNAEHVRSEGHLEVGGHELRIGGACVVRS